MRNKEEKKQINASECMSNNTIYLQILLSHGQNIAGVSTEIQIKTPKQTAHTIV